jgi:hypothetical protein
VTAELDSDSSKANDLYRKLSRGNKNGRKVKLGLSVKGQVTDYDLVYDHEIQKSVPQFNNLIIKEVSVTQQPVYPTPYYLAISKSLTSDPGYAQALEESMTNIEKSDTVVHPALSDNNTEQKNIEGDVAAEQNQNAAEDANVPLQDVTETEAAQVVANTQVETSEAPSEPQRVSETVAEDSNANDVPPGYVASPSSESEQQEAVAQEVSTDPAQAEPAQSLQASIEALAQMVASLREQVEALQNPPVEAQKAQTEEVVAEPAIPTEDEILNEKISIAVVKAFESLGLKKIADEVEVVKSTIADIASQPNNKSISVSKAKDPQDDNDPMAKFQRLKSSGKDSISAAFHAVLDA